MTKFIKFLYTKLAIDFLNHNSSTYVNVRKLFILFYIKKKFTYQKNFNIIFVWKNVTITFEGWGHVLAMLIRDFTYNNKVKNQ